MPELLDSIKQAALETWESEKPCDVMFGTVTSTSPLIINVEQKFNLSSEQLILTRNVTDYNLEMEVDHLTESTKTEEPPHSHSILSLQTELPVYEPTATLPNPEDSLDHKHEVLNGLTDEYSPPSGDGHTHGYKGIKMFKVLNALKINEKVILIRKSGGQQFIVIDRRG